MRSFVAAVFYERNKAIFRVFGFGKIVTMARVVLPDPLAQFYQWHVKDDVHTPHQSPVRRTCRHLLRIEYEMVGSKIKSY